MANTIEIIIKATDQASKTLDQIEAKATSGAEKTSKSFSGLGLAAKAAALGGIALLGEGLKASVEAAMEGELALAKTNAVIKSTGGIAGYTAEQIVKMSEAWAQQTGVGHDVIQNAENIMLTFTEIGHDAFPQAMEAAMNLSAALGTDLQGSVIQVGKALQDPINGMTALRRVGVNFNDESKKTVENFIKIGDLASAQKFILAELSKEFGGVATAVGETLTGKIGKLNDAFDKIKEKVGEKVIPILSDAADAALLLADSSDRLREAFIGNQDKMIEAVKSGKMSLEDYNRAVDATAESAGLVSHSFIVGTGAVIKYDEAVRHLTPALLNATSYADNLKDSILGSVNIDTSNQGLINYIKAEESGMKRAADAAQALADKQAALLTVGIAGALKNEAKSFGQSQEELRKRLKETGDELAALERQQGAVAKTTVKNAMSTNELTLANARLADMQRQLSKETDPIKQAELAAQIGVQRDKLNEANTAVSTYVDNSKRIGELKGQYDDINKEIAGNVAAHEDATKRILYGYAEQLLAREGLTKAETDALNKLAVQFGIKSQDDVNAFEAIRNAADRLAKDENIDIFVDKVTGRLTILEQSAQALADKGFAPIEHAFIKAKDNIEKYGSEPVIVKTVLDTKKAKTDATALVTSKEMKKVAEPVVTPIKADTNAAITSLNWLDRYGIQPLITEYDALIVRAQTFNAIVAATPTIPGTTGGTGGTGEPVRPPGSGPQAQYGANFIVPPGYPGDSFPLRVSSGEHVTVTPAGQRSNMPAINITQNFSGAQSSPEQYKSIMYEVITDVIKQAVQ